MLNEKLTFNDLPEMVGKLCERIESLENALKDNLAKQAPVKENLHVPMTVEEVCSYLGISKSSFYYKAKHPVKENLHVPMTVEEVCSYLGISKSSFYYKAKHGGIPTIKQGKHLFVYRDELDKWLETGRKGQVPLSIEEEHEQMLAATRHKAKPREL